jgi:hypothetical protein
VTGEALQVPASDGPEWLRLKLLKILASIAVSLFVEIVVVGESSDLNASALNEVTARDATIIL